MGLNAIELTGLVLFFIGFSGLVLRKHIVKTILSLGIAEVGIIVFFLGINYIPGAVPPIGENAGAVADPVGQALMITAIVIGAAVTSVSLTMFISLYRKYAASDWEQAKSIRDREEEE